ncbi:hypothetical protein [Candidatus Ichthyocystis hellenicum]|uniref:hypothetical protein n=1 Tax=Candidatus Ichthyocystis hellenicum TaxID=1561003 RepID=UPI000A545E5C|nr:hypothetical protein [Candidatus Ichthyocystis hellenicum]
MRRELSSTSSGASGCGGNDERGGVDRGAQPSSALELEQSAMSVELGGFTLEPHLAMSLGMQSDEMLFRSMFYGTPQASLVLSLAVQLIDKQEEMIRKELGEGTSSAVRLIDIDDGHNLALIASNEDVIRALLDSIEEPPFAVVPEVVEGVEATVGKGPSAPEAVAVEDICTVHNEQVSGVAEQSIRDSDGGLMLALERFGTTQESVGVGCEDTAALIATHEGLAQATMFDVKAPSVTSVEVPSVTSVSAVVVVDSDSAEESVEELGKEVWKEAEARAAQEKKAEEEGLIGLEAGSEWVGRARLRKEREEELAGLIRAWDAEVDRLKEVGELEKKRLKEADAIRLEEARRVWMVEKEAKARAAKEEKARAAQERKVEKERLAKLKIESKLAERARLKEERAAELARLKGERKAGLARLKEVSEEEKRRCEETGEMKLEEARRAWIAAREARAIYVEEEKARAVQERKAEKERLARLKAEVTEEGRARLMGEFAEEEILKEEVKVKREREIGLLKQEEEERRVELERIELELGKERAARNQKKKAERARLLEESKAKRTRLSEERKAKRARLVEENRAKRKVERGVRQAMLEWREVELGLEKKRVEKIKRKMSEAKILAEKELEQRLEREREERIKRSEARMLEKKKAAEAREIAVRKRMAEADRLNEEMKAKRKAKMGKERKVNTAAKRDELSKALEDRERSLVQDLSEVLRKIQEDKVAQERVKMEEAARMRALAEERSTKMRRELAEEREMSAKIRELELELGRVRRLEGSRDMEERVGMASREELELELDGVRVQERNLSLELDSVRARAVVLDREIWEGRMVSGATAAEIEAKKNRFKELSKERVRLRVKALELEIGLSKARIRARGLVLELERQGVREQGRD